MDAVKLTKDEKRVLKLAEMRYSKQPQEFSRSEYTRLVRQLKRKGLVDAVFVIGDRVSVIWLTDYGLDYLQDNPKMQKPLTAEDLRKFINDIRLMIALILGLAGVIAVFVACNSFVH